MKIAFFVYPTAFQAPGGGEIQLLKTREYLEKEGVEVKLFDPWKDKMSDFDIFHTFGSVKECLNAIRTARLRGVKTVLSTICWYSWKSAWLTYTEPKARLASAARHVAKSFFPFLPSMRKSMMEESDLLFPNSESEAEQLRRFFAVPREKIFVVPNGVDPVFEQAKPDDFIQRYGLRDFVLMVGRIEPRKNQLNMVRALRGAKFPVVFVGEPVHHYQDYYAACKREAGGNIHFLGAIPHESGLLSSAYAACNTFLLATWLETPGLAALEAGLAGTKLVITDQGATKEYFGEYAAYVAPDRIAEIRSVTAAVFEKPKNGILKEHIKKNYLWQHVAKRTLEGYRLLLKEGPRPFPSPA